MYNYKLANLSVQSNKPLSIAWESFKCMDCDSSNAVSVEYTDSITVESNYGTVAHPQFTTTPTTTGYIYKYLGDNSSAMEVDKDYTKVFITSGTGEDYLLRLAIECRLIKEGFISLHGACVVDDSSAIIFTGNSGIGKSTRAACWVDANNLEMISGDRPLIDTNSKTVYGVPWDGKEGIFVNKSGKLLAILGVIRAKADECEISKLNNLEAAKILVPQIFIPMWDTDLATMAMANLKNLIASKVLVASLTSGYDEEAARMAYVTLKDYLESTKETYRWGFYKRNRK